MWQRSDIWGGGGGGFDGSNKFKLHSREIRAN